MAYYKSKFKNLYIVLDERLAMVPILIVGISATMCHSAKKIPAKEGCQSNILFPILPDSNI